MEDIKRKKERPFKLDKSPIRSYRKNFLPIVWFVKLGNKLFRRGSGNSLQRLQDASSLSDKLLVRTYPSEKRGCHLATREGGDMEQRVDVGRELMKDVRARRHLTPSYSSATLLPDEVLLVAGRWASFRVYLAH